MLLAADRMMLDYVVKLTCVPAVVEIADVPASRDAKFTGRAISDIIQVATYLSFATRMANCLGVALEDH